MIKYMAIGLKKASVLTEADRHYYGVAESGSSMTMTAHSGGSTGTMIAPIEEGDMRIMKKHL